MPPPRKVDLLPAELKGWLRDELVARGFADCIHPIVPMVVLNLS